LNTLPNDESEKIKTLDGLEDNLKRATRMVHAMLSDIQSGRGAIVQKDLKVALREKNEDE
jgi:hypothetical protein